MVHARAHRVSSALVVVGVAWGLAHAATACSTFSPSDDPIDDAATEVGNADAGAEGSGLDAPSPLDAGSVILLTDTMDVQTDCDAWTKKDSATLNNFAPGNVTSAGDCRLCGPGGSFVRRMIPAALGTYTIEAYVRRGSGPGTKPPSFKVGLQVTSSSNPGAAILTTGADPPDWTADVAAWTSARHSMSLDTLVAPDTGAVMVAATFELDLASDDCFDIDDVVVTLQPR